MSMSYDQLYTFLAALRQHESGNNYLARGPVIQNPNSRYYGERAYGAYQIMPGNWPSWAAQAGIPGADWRDPAAQDRVAKFKVTEYWNRYKDWRLVALAWWAGAGTSDKVVRGGWGAVKYLADPGDTIPRYVTMVMNNMGLDNLDTSLNIEQDALPAEDLRSDPAQMLGAMFSSMADLIAGGPRTTLEEIKGARETEEIDSGPTEDVLGVLDEEEPIEKVEPVEPEGILQRIRSRGGRNTPV